MITRLLRRTRKKGKRPGIGATLTLVLFLLVLLPVVYFVVIHPKQTKAAWFSPNWQFRKKITINDTQVTGTSDLTNFPVVISITDTALGAYAQTDGDDIVFTDINGAKLDHEIATYTTGTGVLIAWVRVPILYAQQDTVMYMYYGNASVSSQQNIQGVWGSDYMGSWHIDETVTDEATTATHRDSALYNREMTQFGNDETASAIIYNGQQLDGNDAILRTSDTQLGFTDGEDRVISGWFYRDNFTTDDTLIAKKSAQGASTGWMIWIDDANDDLNFDIYDGTDLYTVNGSDATTAVGWHHFALVWDDDNASNTKLYIDGQDDTQSRTGTIGNIGTVNPTQTIRFGAESDNDNTLTGRLDEYRMRSSIVSDDWVLTEYNNQSSPGTFATLGTEEISPAPIGYWKFDEGVDNTCSGGTNDACDNSGAGNDLARTNALWVKESECVSGKCNSYDGSGDYFSRTDDADLDFAGNESFTISGWLRHGPQTSGVDVVAVKYDGATDGGYRIQMESDGDISCSIDNDATSFPSDTVTSTAATYDDNKWHHFACVKSTSSSLTLYIDGSQVDQDTSITSSTLANADTFYIGIDGDGSSNGWQGFLDEVKVFRSAKSASEIRSEYNAKGDKVGSSATLGGGGGQGGSDNAQAFLTQGLTGYWKMDEAAANSCTGGTNDSCDSSGNANDGAWSGNTTVAAGKFGNALTLDGTDDYVDFGDPSSGVLDPGSDSFTYSLWVRPATNIGDYDMPLFKGGSSALVAGYDIELGNDVWAASVSDGTSNVFGQFTATGTTGTWKMLTVVIDRSTKTLRLFMDGEQVDSKSIETLGSINTTSSLRLGVDSNSDFDYNGLIDDVRIYKRALSPAEVKSLYNWAAGPIGYWKMDDNTGTTAVDSSGTNGNAATLTSGPTWGNGKYGSGVTFDGTDDNLTLTTPSFRNTLKSFSYSAWVQVTGTFNASANDQFPLFFNLNGQTLYPRAAIRGDGRLNLQLRTNGVTQSFQSQSSGPFITANTWHHVEITFDGATNFATMYINGVLVGTTTFNAGTLDGGTTGNVILGNDTNQSIFFKGNMDDIRLYNYARNAAQVIQDMNGGHPLGGSPVGSAVGNWALDEQGGQTAYDQNSQLNLTLGSSASSDTNDPTWLLPSSCKINGCLDFDGSNDYAGISDNDNLDMLDSDDFSITGWFYRDTTNTDDTIIAKRNGQASGDTGYIAYIDDANDNLIFEVSDGTDEYEVAGTTTFSTGWNHFAIVFDQDNASLITMYVNGTEEKVTKTGTLSSIGTLANSVALRLGAESDAGNPFDGRLDDVKLYKAALSTENVRIDYNANASINLGTKSIEANNLNDGAGNNPNLYFNFDENGASASAQTITLDAVTHIATPAAASSATFPHPVTGTQPNRMLLVAINSEDGSTTDLVATSVTYGGQIMTRAVGSTVTPVTSSNRADIWFLKNPPFGANNVVVTMAGPTDFFSIAALSFYNVKQDFPEAVGSNNNTSGTVTTVNITPTSNNAMIVDSVTNNAATTFTAGTSQTERFDQASASHGSAGSSKLWAVAGATTMVQTAGSTGRQAHVAVAMAPAVDTVTSTDRSGNNLTTTLAGGMDSNSWTAGKYGSALTFNGTNNYASIATPGFSTGDFTIEGWVNTTDSNGNIFQITDDDTLEREIAITIGEDATAGTIGGYINAAKIVESTTVVNDGSWHHFALSRSGSAVSLYIDGILEATATNSTTLDIGTCSAVLGAQSQTTSAPCVGTPTSSFYLGSVDELKTFTYARTPGQIAYDFNRGKPLGWWKADECTGPSIYDSSGKSFNGTLTIGATGSYTSAGNCNSGTSTQSWNTGSAGKYNASFALDGTDDWVDMNNITLYNWSDTNDFSISGWFYRSSANTDDTIVAKRNGQANTDDGFIVYVDDSTDKLTFEVSESGGTDEYQLESTSTFTTTGWNHFTIVFDQDNATNTTMYINGKDDSPTKTGTIGNIGALNASTADFRIGSESDNGSPFDGKIDDIRVFNYALSATQAKQVTNNGSAVRFGPTEGSP